MEDRHSISEPRPITRDPTCVEWEVDILRDDTVIVDTFVINNEILPPRTNKKGKVLWRLPDSMERLPAFGSEDRRRILDIFKDRKKKRKQEKKKCQERDAPSGDSGDDSPARISRNNFNLEDDKCRVSPGRDHNQIPVLNWKHDEDLSKHRNGPTFKEGDDRDIQSKHAHNQKNNCANNSKASSSYKRQQSGPLPCRPPPGLSDQSVAVGAPNECADRIQDPSEISANNPQTQRPQQPSSPIIEYPSQLPLVPAYDARFIIVPRVELECPLPGEQQSLAVPAARHFIASYYSYLENASSSMLISDLARYYTTKAQKSISIGGAHSVVQGRKDINTQIMSLAGSSFLVRGVVAQDAYDGHGVHILITGTAKTICNAVAGGVLAFAHSVSLSPLNALLDGSRNWKQMCPTLVGAFEEGFPFQIHNDALAFLSGEALPSQQFPATPHSPQQQQPPPPPPGLS